MSFLESQTFFDEISAYPTTEQDKISTFCTSQNNVIYEPVPVREDHHDVQRCQQESEMKERIVISNTKFFIVINVLMFWFSFFSIVIVVGLSSL